ncbi:MAG: tyrosine--tRNA ligase [Alphaproteobacteria bacterium CG_4_10_14_0_8_um_filter_53_9]|nr:MAG: tyrosine--tRNA ligase [Alphaproteobacteria bacterium CG_4_10_14_0_8_um_filter_53_9]
MNTPADILQDLTARGLLAQSTKGLEEHLSTPRTLYCGFDPTADSLHIGSLVPLLTLRRFQQYGHTPIVLVGGATGLIGDPSFKAQERQLNTEDTVQTWAESLKQQTSRFVDFESQPNPARMANNFDWTHTVSILGFLRDIGKHFSVNNLIGKEAIKSRLEREDSGISYTEFTYPLLQAYDFQQLFKNHACTLQIGGSDQWGNMTAGTELIRKTIKQEDGSGAEAHVLTLPLVTKADGTKFGKTESGTIWLSAEKTSPYAFYQFWLNTADADIANFVNYFSFKPLEEIKSLIAAHTANPGAREAAKTLAEELTTLVHGEAATTAAKRISEALFSGNVENLTAEDYAQLAQDGLPTTKAEGETTLTDALIATNLASSKREAREFIQNGAVQVNGQTMADTEHALTRENAAHNAYHLLKRGKKLFALLQYI